MLETEVIAVDISVPTTLVIEMHDVLALNITQHVVHDLNITIVLMFKSQCSKSTPV